MRWALACLLAGCVADVDAISDDPLPANALVVKGSGITAGRLGRHVGLTVGFNNRRLGNDAAWTLAHPDVFHADVDALAPGLLRFPGGTIAEQYDWDGATGTTPGTAYVTGTACPSAPLSGDELHWQPFKPVMTAAAPRPDTIDALVAEKPAGTGVDFTLNLIDRTKYAETAMLDAAASKGLAIDRVELGNEFYYPGTSTDGTCDVFARAFPTAADYAHVAGSWARTIAAKYPAARIAVVANERFDDRACTGAATRERCWNHDLLQAGLDPAIHALAIHPYIWHRASCGSHDMYDDAASLIGAALEMADSVMARSRTADPSHGVLGASLAAWTGAIWVTEMGYFNYHVAGSADWGHRWASGLGVLAYALRLTSDPRITVILHHNISDALWALDDPAGHRGATARGVAMAQLDRALADASPTTHDDVWRLSFTRGQYTVTAACGYSGNGPVTYDALLGRWFTHDYDRNGVHGGAGVIVNLGDRAVALDLAGLYATSAEVTTLAAPPDAETDDAITPAATATVMLDSAHHEVTIPAHGIVRFRDR